MASSSDSMVSSSDSMVSSSDSEESSSLVVEEMTEAIATLRNNTGDVSAVTDNAAILKTKVLDPCDKYATKSERLYLGDHLADIGAAQVLTSNIAWLRGLEHGGFSEDVWPYMYVLYGCCHNYTDCSKRFAEELGKSKIIPVLIHDLQEFKDTWTTSQRYEDVVDISLGTLYNMSRYSSIRPLFDEINTIESLIPFLKAENEAVKTMVTLTLAYVIDEENLGIMADPSVIRFIIEVFTQAVDNEKKSHLGYSAAELAMGVEKLAVNDTLDDNNKLTLVAEGLLPPLIKLMTEGDEEEQLHAIRAISQLAFHPDNKEKILQLKVIPKLLEFAQSLDTDTAVAAKGALWELQGVNARKQKVEEPGAGKTSTDETKTDSRAGHVMLSYQWDNQEVVKKIKATLEATSYKVWMDIDQMGGSTLEAMAEAVEGAAVVLICMSRKYKESANCRRECHYAATRGTDIIPLKMENTYQPDGWLGITMGGRLYFNFDGKDSFKDVMARLMRELGDRGKGHTAAGAEVDTVGSKLEGLKLPRMRKEPEGAVVVKKGKSPRTAALTPRVEPMVRSDETSAKAVFLSYQWDHQEKVLLLHERLQERGYSCWIDINEMGGGDKLYKMMDKGIRGAKVVVSCVTPPYTTSQNCQDEVALAHTLNTPIIPVMLEKTTWPPPGPMSIPFVQLIYINMTKSQDDDPWKGALFEQLVKMLG
uniref:TIR domain-containing protein n=1 Tax=Branchiostoma floridae TaxID=7739 RepID=C3YRI1_BRAFL|eukprot:XP_002601166.1 hypothetical protein BRAFLDRAFT_75615 [Branchiostoma floridae]